MVPDQAAGSADERLRQWDEHQVGKPSPLCGWQLILFSMVYFFGVGLSHWLNPSAAGWGVSFWVPSGLYLSVLALTEPRQWPAVILAALPPAIAAPPLFLDFPPVPSAFAFLGDTLEAVAGALLLRRWAGGPFRLHSIPDVLALVLLGTLLSPMLSASVGALTLAAMGAASFASVWPLWWIGNASGSLVVASSLLPVAAVWADRRALPARWWLEAICLVAVSAAMIHLVFSSRLPLMFFLVLPMFWATLRFELIGTTATIPLLTPMAARYTESGSGPFAGTALSAEEQRAWVEIFLLVAASTILMIGAINRQRREALVSLDRRVAERTAALEASEQRQRRLAESVELERSRLEAVVQNLPAGVWIADANGRLLAKNHQADQIWGGDMALAESPQDYLRYPIWDEASGRALRWDEHPLAQTLATGCTVDSRRLKIQRIDGTLGMVLCSSAPIQDRMGQVLGAVAVCLDNTKRAAMESALSRSEIFLRNVLDSLPASIVVLDESGTIRMTNLAWEQAAHANGGQPAAVSIGANYLDVCRRATAAGNGPDAQAARAALDALEAVRSGCVTEAVVEYACAMPAGCRWYLMHASALKDGLSGLVVSHSDVTLRKQAEAALRDSEERFHLFMDHIPVLAWIKDLAGRYTYLNHPYEHQLGIRIEEWLTKTDAELWPEETAVQFRSNDQAVLAAGQATEFFEESPNPNGSVRYWHSYKFPFQDGCGNRFVGGIGLDITEPKQIERERLVHLQFLEKMDRVNQALQGTNGLEAVLNATLDVLLEILECDRAWLIYPCDPEAAEWESVAERTRPEFPGAFAQNRKVPVDGEVVQVFRTVRAADRPVKFGPGGECPVPGELAEQFQIRAQMALAIYPKVGKPWMFGVHQCAYPREWSAEDERLLREAGPRLADALSILLAHRDLETSEARLAQAQRTAHIGYWDCDHRTDLMILSVEARRIFGLPLGNRPFTTAEWQSIWRDLIHPEDYPRIAQATADALENGRQLDEEYRVTRADGAQRFIHCVADITRDVAGRPLRWFGMVQDITERRQMEARLRSADEQRRQLMVNSRDGILILDQDYRIIEANPQQARMLGYSVAELSGMRPWDLDAQWTETEIRAGLAKAGVSGAIFETRHRRKDGSTYDAEVSCSPAVIDGQTVYLDVVRDITDRKRQEEGLRDASRRKDEFLAMLAHELRNPLAPIRNACEIFKRFELPEPELRWAHQVIQRQVQHLARLVDDLLEVSRISRGKITLKIETLTLAALIERAVEACQPALELRKQALILERPLPECRFKGDEVRLVQVLTNVLGNAAKYSDEGKRIWLSAERVGTEVAIRVKDEGIGIAPELLAHIFDLFTQAERSIDRSQGGLGIGLALVRRLVEMHAGRVTAASDGHGKGSEFVVWLQVEPS